MIRILAKLGGRWLTEELHRQTQGKLEKLGKNCGEIHFYPWVGGRFADPINGHIFILVHYD